jgi:trk system potassium uptake protein TrkH
MFGGMNLFDALCHTFGTMATGGFSTKNASIGAYDSMYIHYIITFFMILAGTNFALHYRLLTGDIKSYFRNREFLFFLSIIGVGFLFIGVDTCFFRFEKIADALQHTLFQVVSIVTTTGYGTADYEKWGYNSQLMLFFLLFVGGCAGSTGGSIKVVRILVVFKFIYSEIIRLLHPHAVVPIRIGDNVIPREALTNIIGLFILFVLIFIFGSLVMAMLGLTMDTAMGSVAATLGNIGPGLGDVGPTDNYAHIPGIGKWLLCSFMLMGRLEVFTVIILLAPTFWRK